MSRDPVPPSTTRSPAVRSGPPPSSPPSSPSSLPLGLARWVEARLHECLADALADPFRFDARLYGLTVHDVDGVHGDDESAVRQSCLGEAGSVYDLIDGPAGAMARLYDAAAVVTTGWAAPLPEGDGPMGRPRHHPHRRRVRLVVVVHDVGVGSVLRFADDPDRVIAEPGGSGMLAEALDDLWACAGAPRELGPAPRGPESSDGSGVSRACVRRN